MTKPDFSKTFAQNGAILPLTDTQFLQGFDYLGANPPTKEEFNWLFQQFCLKLQYLEENSGLNLWQPEHIYAIGDICYSKTANSYKYLECIQAGTTSSTEPTWPAVGQEVTDGTVRWRVRDIKNGSGVGIGTVMPFLATKPQPGWLACDTGAIISRDTYKELWASVQQNAPLISESEWQAQAAVQSSVGAYSTGDGSTTFRLPRIVDYVRGGLQVDAGKWQGDAIRNITGNALIGKVDAQSATFAQNGAFAKVGDYPGLYTGGGSIITGQGGINLDASRVVPTADENRPKTIKFLYCVKAFDAPTNQGMIDITALANEMANKLNKTDYSADFAKGLGANGFQKLPSGLIIQWGSGFTASSGFATVTFPIAFPNACCSVTGSHNGGGGAMFIANTMTKATFQAQITTTLGGSSGGSHGFFWMAIGG